MEAQLFDFPKLEITNKIRLIELFGGIGSQAMALRDIGADFEHYRLVEFDKYAVASYNAIHGTSFETADIRNVHGADLGIVDRDKFTYIMTYSFPCTDLSVAGKMKGMSKAEWEQGNSTRSGLLWEVERILKELPADELPQVLLMENVPQVHAEQNKPDFDAWLAFLRSRGYFNFYQDLNAKDYGIPQNRDRCFCVSILSPEFIEYNFPEPVKLEKVMRDFLEDQVDEKYYFNTQKAKDLIEKLVDGGVLGGLQEHQTQRNDGVCPCLTAAMGLGGGQIPVIKEKDNRTDTLLTIDLCLKKPSAISVANCIKARYDAGISNLQADGSGVIEIKQATKEGTIKCKVGGCYDASFPNSTTRRGRVQEGGDVVPTLTAGSNENIRYVETVYRIRKLTPRECWRLMGYTDEDYDKAEKVNSNTQLYKQAGNAIVKQVLMAIFAQMIPESARLKQL